jgi:O-antigen/teichoic acid export membrane protein
MNLRISPRLTPLRHIASSHFVRQVLETYLTRVLVVALGLVNSILVTRILGPEGRGLFAVATTLAAIGVQLGNLGLHSSNTYYVSRERTLLPTLLGNSLLVSSGAAGATFVAYLLLSTRPELTPLTGPLLILALVSIPVGLSSLLLQNLLIGILEIRAYNTIDLTTRVMAVLLIAATVPLGVVTPEIVFGLVLATLAIGLVWAFVRLHSHLTRPVACSAEMLSRGLRYGLKGYFGSLFAFLVLRSDIVLLNYLRGAEDTGYYAVAAGLADVLLMLPTVVGTLLFPRLAAAPDLAERLRLTRRVLKVLVPATPAALLVVLVLARPLVRLVYGGAFDPSVDAILWLLPGVGFLAVNGVLMNLFAACGMPMIIAYSPLVALITNVLVNLWLIPAWGIVGASMSSTLAYGLMLLMSLGYIRWGSLEAKRA